MFLVKIQVGRIFLIVLSTQNINTVRIEKNDTKYNFYKKCLDRIKEIKNIRRERKILRKIW
jgi:hypothetical protein